MTTQPQLILASASPRRAELLGTLGHPFRVVTSAVPETEDESLGPSGVALANARRKAQAVAAAHPDALVLGADTVVALGNKLFGKPRDMAEAERFLMELAGQTHEVVTGVCLRQGTRQREFAVRSEVEFRAFSPEVARAYIAKVNVLDKAGAYAIQEHGEMIVRRFEGSRSNIIGLPLEAVERELVSFGFNPLPAGRGAVS